MIRVAALALAALMALPTAPRAACTGASAFDLLTPEEQTELEAAVERTPYPRGLRWTATRGADRIDLVGTMHIWDPRLLPLLERVTPDIAAAELILLEMTEVERDQLQNSLLEQPGRFFITDGPTLPDLLTPEMWEAVRTAAADRNIPAFMAAKHQPWFLGLSLSIPACAMEDMIAGREGLDQLIIDTASDLGRPMAPLEDWDTLFILFEEFLADDQVKFLESALAPSETQTALFTAMLDGYFAGEIARIWELSRVMIDDNVTMTAEEAEAMFAETERLLLTVRNARWMDRIAAALEDHDRVMVAAGAGHLPGDTGLLSLLAAEGWNLSPAD